MKAENRKEKEEADKIMKEQQDIEDKLKQLKKQEERQKTHNLKRHKQAQSMADMPTSSYGPPGAPYSAGTQHQTPGGTYPHAGLMSHFAPHPLWYPSTPLPDESDQYYLPPIPNK